VINTNEVIWPQLGNAPDDRYVPSVDVLVCAEPVERLARSHLWWRARCMQAPSNMRRYLVRKEPSPRPLCRCSSRMRPLEVWRAHPGLVEDQAAGACARKRLVAEPIDCDGQGNQMVASVPHAKTPEPSYVPSPLASSSSCTCVALSAVTRRCVLADPVTTTCPLLG